MNVCTLKPILAGWMRQVIRSPQYLDTLLHAHGSPVNLIHPMSLSKNASAFQACFASHELPSRIFYARKANKCTAFVEHANRSGLGIECASEWEISDSLKHRVSSANILCTAAVKEPSLQELCISHRILTVVDNMQELESLSSRAGHARCSLPVLLRISGFYDQGVKSYSRFGFDIGDLATPLAALRQNPGLTLSGFHFHLDGYSIEQRARAAHTALRLLRSAREAGFEPSIIDIGGGFTVRYLESRHEWERFLQSLREALRGESEEVTFNNDGLGLMLINGEVHGSERLYPFWNSRPRERFLDAILRGTAGNSELTLAEELRSENITLAVEPGRALLDQCGITCARVIHMKLDCRGRMLIALDMNSTQLRSVSLDFCVDPILISLSNEPVDSGCDAYLVGSYCMEQDLILRRKIRFETLPRPGDVIAFPNTAAYLSHLWQSPGHKLHLAKNVICDESIFSREAPGQ